MRINEIIPFTLNQFRGAYTYIENVISQLFQRIFSHQSNSVPERLESAVTQIKEDPAVQQIADGVFGNVVSKNSTQSLISQERIDNLKSAWTKQIANEKTKSLEVCEQVCKEAVDIFGEKEQGVDHRFSNLFGLLDEFNFDRPQRKRIYVAITGAKEDSPQVAKLLDATTPFKDFADIYTLQFADGEEKVSKAELCTYGNYFKALFNSEFNHSRILNLEDSILVPPNSNSLTAFFRRIILLQETYDLLPINVEHFNLIKSFIRGETDLDLEDLETFNVTKTLANYFQVGDIERLYCKTIDEAIALAQNHRLQEIDLMKYEGTLTDKHIDQILSLPALRRIDGTIDLKALFPKLSIIDDAVWKAHADMAANGLDVDMAIDMRAAIRNLHQMYRTLNIEGDAGITLLKMPKGLTLKKLLAIVSKPLQGNPVSCPIRDEIVNQYGDNPITEGYTVAITDSVLEKSRDLSPSAQQELVQKNGCNMPALLDMMALTLMTCLSSSEEFPTRLYGVAPLTYSRVGEKSPGSYLFVGAFMLSGLDVRYYDFANGSVGVAGLRKF